MKPLSDPDYLEHQYRTSANLDVRNALHARFSRNPQGWHRWVIAQLNLPPAGRILEVGCGSGNLWRENRDRLPARAQLILTDASAGMLAASRRLLTDLPARTGFARVNAGEIPFPAASFEVVIANHMLYHVPDLASTLGEIRRVLCPGGRLCASTNGATHMRELDDLAARFDPACRLGQTARNLNFNLENGAELLSRRFGQVELRRYVDGLEVSDASLLAAYIASCLDHPLPLEQARRMEAWVQDEINRAGGAYKISKDTGLFIAAI